MNCEYNTQLKQNQVYTRKCNQFRIYSHWVRIWYN